MIQDVIKKIDEIAEQEPDRVVYDYLGKTNTYGDLKKRSNAWAHKIASLDISDDAPIMIWGGQTFEMIASFLGCVKTGHAYIPIASYSNAERLTMIQDVSKSPLVLEIDPLPDVNLDNVKVLKAKLKMATSLLTKANLLKAMKTTTSSSLQVLLVNLRVYKSVTITYSAL